MSIRLLRKVPHTEAFDRHLDHCALAAIWFDERLTVRKLLGLSPLQSNLEMSLECLLEEIGPLPLASTRFH